MSGICAVWRKDGPESAEALVRPIARELVVDGSERVRTLAKGDGALGIAARFDTQQIFGSSRILVVCDADVINEDELRAATPPEGPVEQGSGTAALFASLYQRFGWEFVKRLEGSFSFVLWDAEERKLVAGVDSFGINRLALYQDTKVLLLSTRVDALVRSGAVEQEIDPRAIANVINFSSNLAPLTILRKVERVLPGTVLIGSSGKLHVEKYWMPRYGVQGGASERELSRELETVMERSVATHQGGSPGSLGAFLSGGTDSSTVVGMMARTGQRPVKSFSIGFQEEAFNELGYAQITADWFHTEHHTYRVGPDDCFDALPAMVRSFDEPYGNSSAIPTFFCARLAAQSGVNCLLAGDGGDELFGGNERYRTDKIFDLYQRVPRLVRKGLIEPALAVIPFESGPIGKTRRYVRRSNIPRLDRYFSYNLLCAHDPAEVFTPEFYSRLAGCQLLEIPRNHYESASATDGLDRLLYLDLNITLSDNDLPKVTRMCELAGVRVRFPFLDRSVAEFSGRIPASLKVKGLEKRYLFKQAFRRLLPPAVLQKKKHGFGLPVAFWLKSNRRLSELARDVLGSKLAQERGFFNRSYMEGLFRANENEESPYYGDMLWIFLTLELWLRQVADRSMKVPA